MPKKRKPLFGSTKHMSVHQSHIDLPRIPLLLPPFEQALRTIFPAVNRRAILAFFNNRVTWGAIRHWRMGRVEPPQWARNLVKEKIDAEVAHIESLIYDLRNYQRKPKGDPTAGLKRWRHERAMAREKEKTPD